MSFLSDRDSRDLSEAPLDAITPDALFLGGGSGGLEVAHFISSRPPTSAQLKELHTKRHRGRPAPVLIVVSHGRDRAALVTRFGDEWATKVDLPRSQVERLAAEALDAPDRHIADAVLRSKLPQLDLRVPGLRNAGLFALHELEEGVPRRADWSKACTEGARVLARRGRELIEKLGFVVEQLPHPVSVLRARGTRVAVAVLLERPDEIEPASTKFDGLSPVSYALAKADAENVDYVVVSAGSVLRVYPAKPGVGTARRGRTETFVSLDLALLDDASAGYLTLLASAAALAPDGSFTAILDASKRFAANLGARLRDRIYDDVMPALTESLYRAQRLRNPSRERLQETFEMALLTLFRLLFVAYAEDKELLPYNTSESYREHSLKRIAQRLAADVAGSIEYGREDFFWTEVSQLWKAVDKGNAAWRVPAYNGGLFASSAEASKAAQRLADLSLPDSAFAPALAALLLDATTEGVQGPVDFRALGVREFGTIYEGLLEQELSVAEQDLVVDANGAYVPVGAGRAKAKRGKGRQAASAEPDVHAGEVYLHDKSGARKASGAYYTKDFAVEHLLERALEPALVKHLARLSAMYDDRDAADRFFDFHVADIAMGSGHFLVAAVDHLERGLSGYLAKRPLAGVRDELARLRKTATNALGEDWRGDTIEDTQLLRRQIARRCIHGVDLNPLAVELARLSLWIHTFVPGLPLSFLDANLVVGNALVGIATLEEARELMPPDDLFGGSAEELLGKAKEPLAKLGRLAEATAGEVKDARKLYEQVKRRVAPANDLFMVLAASRIDSELAARVAEGNIATRFSDQGTLDRDRWVRTAEEALEGLRPLHFPVAFPQVFLRRERPGFDVILGNPPWKKPKLEEHAFWSRYEPGLRALRQDEMSRRIAKLRASRQDLTKTRDSEIAGADRLRAVLTAGPFPGMSTGDADVYKAFCWRFWALVSRDGGHLGVVLPRSAFAAKGSAKFRQVLFKDAQRVELTMLTNTGGWVFDEAEHRYTIALCAVTRGRSQRAAEIILEGPFSSYKTFARVDARVAEPTRFSGDEPELWNDSSSLPLLPAADSGRVFAKLRAWPRFDTRTEGFSFRAYREFDTSDANDSFELFPEKTRKACWPVYKGESFDVWRADTGSYLGWADPREVIPLLLDKRTRSARMPRSPFSGLATNVLSDAATLVCQRPRIAYRRVSRATDTRTLRAALVPGKLFLVDTAPCLVRLHGALEDEAFLLGILSSLPLDWYARRFVETHVDFHLFDSFPIPFSASASRRRIVSIAARLAVDDDERFEEWGAALGIAPQPIADDKKADLIHELDAAVAQLYGLAEPDLVHIFETFHEGWHYQDRLDATLKYFHRLKA